MSCASPSRPWSRSASSWHSLGVCPPLPRWRAGERLPSTPWFFRAVVAAGPLAVVALIAGWVTTEVGRQPWVVYGVMRTEEAVTGADGIPVGYATLVVVYTGLIAAMAWILRRLARVAARAGGRAMELAEAPLVVSPRRPRRLHGARRRRLRGGPMAPPQRARTTGAPARAHASGDGPRLGGEPRLAHLRARGLLDGLSGRVRVDRVDASGAAVHRGRGDHHARNRVRAAERERLTTAGQRHRTRLRCRRCSPRSRSEPRSAGSRPAGCRWATRRATSSRAGSTRPRS